MTSNIIGLILTDCQNWDIFTQNCIDNIKKILTLQLKILKIILYITIHQSVIVSNLGFVFKRLRTEEHGGFSLTPTHIDSSWTDGLWEDSHHFLSDHAPSAFALRAPVWVSARVGICPCLWSDLPLLPLYLYVYLWLISVLQGKFFLSV